MTIHCNEHPGPRRKPQQTTAGDPRVEALRALPRGQAVVLLDETESWTIREGFERACQAEDRGKPIVLSLSRPDLSTPINLLAGCREPGELAAMLEALQPSESAEEREFNALLARALLSVERSLTLTSLRSYLERGPDALVAKLYDQAHAADGTGDQNEVIHALSQFCDVSRPAVGARIASLVPILVMLCAGEWGRLLSPSPDLEPLTRQRIADGCLAVYLGIPTHFNVRASGAIKALCEAAFADREDISLLITGRTGP